MHKLNYPGTYQSQQQAYTTKSFSASASIKKITVEFYNFKYYVQRHKIRELFSVLKDEQPDFDYYS